MRKNEIMFISFQLVGTASVEHCADTHTHTHTHTHTERHYADRVTDSVVKVEGKRMKGCIFLLVLGWLQTSAVFSLYLVKDIRHIHALTQRSRILNAQRM